MGLEEAKEAIKSWLAGATECEVPCIFGIIPGKTTLREAIEIFTNYGLETKSSTLEGKDFYGIHYDFNSGPSISVILTVHDQLVRNLRVKISPEPQKAGGAREWLAYSPETLIKRYGIPSRVDFGADWGPRPYFEMQMYFDVEELIVQYTGVYILTGSEKSSLQFCPLAAQFNTAWLWMGKNPIYPPSQDILLEDVTTLTLDEFSKLLTGNPDQACFQINGNMFP